jgi:hypothetical protein
VVLAHYFSDNSKTSRRAPHQPQEPLSLLEHHSVLDLKAHSKYHLIRSCLANLIPGSSLKATQIRWRKLLANSPRDPLSIEIQEQAKDTSRETALSHTYQRKEFCLILFNPPAFHSCSLFHILSVYGSFFATAKDEYFSPLSQQHQSPPPRIHFALALRPEFIKSLQHSIY